MFELENYINEYVTHKSLDIALISLKKFITNEKPYKRKIGLIKFNTQDCIDHISRHLEDVINWATTISFRDSIETKKLDELFIDLDLFLIPVKLRTQKNLTPKKLKLSQLLQSTNSNIVILGQPGAGKTTSIKKILLEIINNNITGESNYSFPILIRLKNLKKINNNDNHLLLREILNILGIFIEEVETNDYNYSIFYQRIFQDFINSINVLIILDGYDEISDLGLKNDVIYNLRLFSAIASTSKFILTSRSADYDYHIEGAKEFEISPLTNNQVKIFIEKWMSDPIKSAALLQSLKTSPYWDTTIRPLTLAHLCALQERNNSIPDKPKSVYLKIVQLLLEDWSNQRSITRTSLYSKFTVERKIDFLSRFAYELTINYQTSEFNLNLLNKIYYQISSELELPKSESKIVVKEIESHNGLIIQTAIDTYEFVHKSIQEYLVAEYLIKLPYLIDDVETILKIPNEIALLVALSTDPSLAFFKIAIETLNDRLFEDEFYKQFISRLQIEKPDYKATSLLALTIVLIFNKLVEKIEKLRLMTGYSITSKNKLIKNYGELIDEILLLKNIDAFEISFNILNNYYAISTVRPKPKMKYQYLTKYSRIYLLKRNTRKFNINNKDYPLPQELLFIDI